jgi:hypothetical protein
MTIMRMGLGIFMRFFLVLAGLAAATLPAAASGGIWCHLEDQSVKLSVDSGVTRGLGAPFFNFRGKLEILDKSVPEKLRTTEFDGQNLSQYWLDDRALKLHLYREWEVDKSFDYVELVIETQAGDDEGLYGGSYKLTIFDSKGAAGEGKQTELGGEINCDAE